MQSVLHIVSQWYSGTSMLNLLLDAQQGIRGLGEAHNLYREHDCADRRGYCSCGESLSACDFYADAPSDGFYRWCLDRYGCDLLVDSSKDIRSLRIAPRGNISARALVMSKSPHGWMHSFRGHHPDRAGDLSALLQRYRAYYEDGIAYGRETGMPMITLTYEAMMKNPAQAVEEICRACGIAYAPEPPGRCWETDTHIMGGNISVYRQLHPEERFFEQDDKYRSRFRTMFTDDAWRNDRAFIGECMSAYERADSRLDDILLVIGQPGRHALMQDLCTGVSAAPA